MINSVSICHFRKKSNGQINNLLERAGSGGDEAKKVETTILIAV